MSTLTNIAAALPRGSAGSEETALKVMELCGKIAPKSAVFIGDELYTPTIIRKNTGCGVEACFTEKERAERAAARGFAAKTVMPFEIPAEGGRDFIWYNGVTAFEGAGRLLEMLYEGLNKGGAAVFRTLCWLIDPSPDTKSYIDRRFGRIEPLDEVLRKAKEQGFKIKDFYIAPKSDWREGLYRPLSEELEKLSESSDGGLAELNKEMDMFELHSEEYSFVYYILGK